MCTVTYDAINPHSEEIFLMGITQSLLYTHSVKWALCQILLSHNYLEPTHALSAYHAHPLKSNSEQISSYRTKNPYAAT